MSATYERMILVLGSAKHFRRSALIKESRLWCSEHMLDFGVLACATEKNGKPRFIGTRSSRLVRVPIGHLSAQQSTGTESTELNSNRWSAPSYAPNHAR